MIVILTSNSLSMKAILKYKTLSKRVFNSASNNPKATFDEKIFEQEIKNIVAAAVGGQSPSMQ